MRSKNAAQRPRVICSASFLASRFLNNPERWVSGFFKWCASSIIRRGSLSFRWVKTLTPNLLQLSCEHGAGLGDSLVVDWPTDAGESPGVA